MPFYEYECEKCKRIFEFLDFNQPTDEDRKCPHCGSSDVKRVISSFGLGDSCSLNHTSFG